MRGLKHSRKILTKLGYMSHLLQMRGLKHFLNNAPNSYIVSHLLQMRGLKPKEENISGENLLVASFTDAWIETFFEPFYVSATNVASFTDAWIETVSWRHCEKTLASHLLQMRGLKQIYQYIQKQEERRIFYRCVD